MGSCLSKKNKRNDKHEVAEVGEIREDDLRGIFREFDLNGDGFIQKDELKAVMIKMGQSPTDEELNAMFNAADKDQDGNIDFHEFLTIAQMQQQLSNQLISQYANHPKGRFFDPQMHSFNDSEIMYYLVVTLIVLFGFFLFCLFVLASAIAIFLCFSIFSNR